MSDHDLETLQASYDALRQWYRHEGGEAIVERSAVEAREAGEALSASLVVDARLLDEAVTY